ncbi:hypothetical protein SPSIL_054470 [Sporomusa silvacetica DSM 10669]|uniref:Uncharacterized protein n=1 Tax=Sporomusa silvacetica DSM 10669 TaxID=1123289 RepID=A0ABZ3IU22_9FIRM|nr:hypothetical protein SPSIL_11290 [Sporomusa silvacetica DSM 10669]
MEGVLLSLIKEKDITMAYTIGAPPHIGIYCRSSMPR